MKRMSIVFWIILILCSASAAARSQHDTMPYDDAEVSQEQSVVARAAAQVQPEAEDLADAPDKEAEDLAKARAVDLHNAQVEENRVTAEQLADARAISLANAQMELTRVKAEQLEALTAQKQKAWEDQLANSRAELAQSQAVRDEATRNLQIAREALRTANTTTQAMTEEAKQHTLKNAKQAERLAALEAMVARLDWELKESRATTLANARIQEEARVVENGKKESESQEKNILREKEVKELEDARQRLEQELIEAHKGLFATIRSNVNVLVDYLTTLPS